MVKSRHTTDHDQTLHAAYPSPSLNTDFNKTTMPVPNMLLVNDTINPFDQTNNPQSFTAPNVEYTIQALLAPYEGLPVSHDQTFNSMYQPSILPPSPAVAPGQTEWANIEINNGMSSPITNFSDSNSTQPSPMLDHLNFLSAPITTIPQYQIIEYQVSNPGQWSNLAVQLPQTNIQQADSIWYNGEFHSFTHEQHIHDEMNQIIFNNIPLQQYQYGTSSTTPFDNCSCPTMCGLQEPFPTVSTPPTATTTQPCSTKIPLSKSKATTSTTSPRPPPRAPGIHACPYPSCNKTYATRRRLNAHKRIHTRERTFDCPDPSCDGSFFRKQDLERHLTTHTKLRSSACEFCGSSFTRKDALNRHVAKGRCRILRKNNVVF
ncbi:hypothetical protein HDU76_013084 [Blyttiomyces sp. JEL0837]|nr:hypothetical protein HDU76_013084 [Blyttiomyces sp. JEL0837]